MKKLYRSRDNRVFAGILGGIGEYFNIDPVLIRLVYILLMIFTHIVPGILVYIIALFIVPEPPRVQPMHKEAQSAP